MEITMLQVGLHKLIGVLVLLVFASCKGDVRKTAPLSEEGRVLINYSHRAISEAQKQLQREYPSIKMEFETEDILKTTNYYQRGIEYVIDIHSHVLCGNIRDYVEYSATVSFNMGQPRVEDAKLKSGYDHYHRYADHSNQRIRQSKTEPKANSQSSISGAPKEDDFYFSWVDNLRIRATPSPDGKVIGSLVEGERVHYIFELDSPIRYYKSELRGKTFEAPWMKIKTGKGLVGYVWGAGLKKVD